MDDIPTPFFGFFWGGEIWLLSAFLYVNNEVVGMVVGSELLIGMLED